MIREITSFSNSSFRSPREMGKEKWDKSSANVKSANIDENFLDSMESLHGTKNKICMSSSCYQYLHPAVCSRTGDVDIAFREWINSHCLLPVHQVACHLKCLSQRDICVQRHYLQAKECLCNQSNLCLTK